jgi:hypothetical protein
LIVDRKTMVDRFAAAVRKALGRYVSAPKIEALRLELILAGIVVRDEGQAPYEVGPPISPLHSLIQGTRKMKQTLP